MGAASDYGAGTLPAGIRSRMIAGINGLDVHLLEAGHEQPDRPCLLLLHGFPELAFSWRKVMVPLADAGFHVVAPDVRGYGRTTGWDASYNADLRPFRLLNLLRDALGLIAALGRRHVAGVIGHDYGSVIAAQCAMIRPDVFRSVVLMSAPFGGPPTIPIGSGKAVEVSARSIDADLAKLSPARKHYHWYYSSRPANDDIMACKQGVHDFMRAYYHHKSADWKANVPHKLAGWTAAELGKLPTYYVMERHQTMAETVAAHMPTPAEIAACKWLTEPELAVYAAEYGRTGYQGGLNGYRCRFQDDIQSEMEVFSGRAIDVPSAFISGASDWGYRQTPGAFERMQEQACTRMIACHIVPGAGHWVQQEQPDATTRHILAFLSAAGTAAR
jgi:pimeloyl-ACP methyl ester carboxylesterase